MSDRDGVRYATAPDGARLAYRVAVFNPGLHLPSEPTATNLGRLDQRMRDAEAAHFLLLMLMLGVVAHAVARGWWAAAGWTLLFDVLVNGYPVMLQRYDRALLRERFEMSNNA